MKWLVMYIIAQLVYIPCPHGEPTPDKFGRVEQNGYYVQTAVLCSETKRTPMQKEFSSLEEAQKFVDEMEAENKKLKGQIVDVNGNQKPYVFTSTLGYFEDIKIIPQQER